MATAAQLVTKIVELVDSGGLDQIEQYVHPDRMRFELDGVGALSTDQFTEFERGWASAFEDQRHTITTTVDAGDIGAVEGTFAATHTGTLMFPDAQIPATGRTVTIGFCIVGEADDGRLVRGTNHYDVLGLLNQIGAAEAATR